MNNAIELCNITKIYKTGFFRKSVGVNDITLNIAGGSTFGLLGPNGSGKTTIIKLILGLIYPDKGKITIFGENPSVNIKQRIGFLPELSYYYNFLNPEEILRFYGGIFGLKGSKLKNRVNDVISIVGLEKARKKRLKIFSKGMLQRLGIAQAIINDPDLLILDEPTIGLDPLGLKDLIQIISDMKTRGKTVIFSSHQLVYAQDLCDRVAIINEGKLIYTDNVDRSKSLDGIFERLVGGAS